MKRSVLKGFARHGVFLAVLPVLSLCVAGLAHAQASGAAEQTAAKAAAPAQMTPSATPRLAQAESTVAKHGGEGMHEGIKVHGHWVIEVRNPDGRLVQRRDFENSLTSVGAQNLPLFPLAVTLGNSPQIVKVTITAPSLLAEQEKPMRGPGSAAPLALAFVLPLLGLGAVRRRLHRGGWLALAALLSFIAIAGLSACVGGSGFFNQPPQTYTVTLTGISGTAQHSTTFNLTVE